MSEQHVENLSGHGVPTNIRDEREFSPSEAPTRWVGASDAAKTQPSTGPILLKNLEKSDNEPMYLGQFVARATNWENSKFGPNPNSNSQSATDD